MHHSTAYADCSSDLIYGVIPNTQRAFQVPTGAQVRHFPVLIIESSVVSGLREVRDYPISASVLIISECSLQHSFHIRKEGNRTAQFFAATGVLSSNIGTEPKNFCTLLYRARLDVTVWPSTLPPASIDSRLEEFPNSEDRLSCNL